MPTAAANGIEICYEDWGAPDAEPLLLVMGLGAQLVSWPPGFCSALLAEGFRVVRYDNRDVGLSTKSAGDPPPALMLLAAAMAGRPVDAPYSLSDMALDGIGLLDQLGIESAHIVGASLGGMIAQLMAVEHPRRVRSLTSIMSTTGNPAVGQAEPAAIAALAATPEPEREAFVEQWVVNGAALSGPLYDPEDSRQRAREYYDRGFNPPGAAFQLAAVAATGDRTERLGRITAPTLVIHGKADPLITLSGGEATAAAIPGAELMVIDDMGHDLAAAHWATIAAAIARNSSGKPTA